jgi:hypothetical protein
MLRIDSLNVVNESDVDWKSLSDPTWNMWSGHCLQQKWKSMKIACELDDSVCHRGECYNILSTCRLSYVPNRCSSSPRSDCRLTGTNAQVLHSNQNVCYPEAVAAVYQCFVIPYSI